MSFPSSLKSGANMSRRKQRRPEHVPETLEIERPLAARIWGVVRPYRWAVAGMLAANGAMAGFEVVPALVFRQIIDAHVIPRRDLGGVTWLAILALASAVAGAAVTVLGARLQERVGQGVT